MKRALACLFCTALGACGVTSDGPLLDAQTALPLVAGLDITRVIDIDEDPPKKLTIRASEDSITLVMFPPDIKPEPTPQDVWMTFHPLPDAPGMLIVQGYSSSADSDTRHYGYGLASCSEDGTFQMHVYDQKALPDASTIDGITQDGTYVPHATSAAGLAAYYHAVIDSSTLTTQDYSPALSCTALFE